MIGKGCFSTPSVADHKDSLGALALEGFFHNQSTDAILAQTLNSMKVIQNLRKELKKNINLEYKANNDRFFKKPIKLYGVLTPVIRQIARDLYRPVQDLSKTELFDVCEQLMSSGMQEEFIVASAWAFKRRKELVKSDFNIFKSWVEKYVSNWATCDDFCSKSLGYLLLDFPDLVPKIKPWTKSKNQWLRRASAVSLIVPIRHSGSSNNHPSSLAQGYGGLSQPLLGKGGGIDIVFYLIILRLVFLHSPLRMLWWCVNSVEFH